MTKLGGLDRPLPCQKQSTFDYPARNGGLEQAFVEACDRDASVDAFCKVSEQKHTFARLRYTQEGLNVCNGNQIEDSRACENVRCPVFETCARVPLRPERLPV